MSKLGTHIGAGPTGLGSFLQMTYDSGSPVPLLFALDINVDSDRDTKSPTTKLIYRTQQFGPDNGNMYAGDPVIAGRARVDQCLSILRLNPADWYALDNEPGRSDVASLSWLCNYYLGEMQRADELGLKLCIGEWSTGMPPISLADSLKVIRYLESIARGRTKLTVGASFTRVLQLAGQHEAVDASDYISIYTPMLRYAAAHGHILGLHEYSLDGPMIGSPLCLRYRALHDALPLDARPLFAITEAGPDAGYATGYTGEAYINIVADYDSETMQDDYLIGVALFNLSKGKESDMSPVMPLLTQYVIDHPTPEVDPVPTNEFLHSHLDGGAANTANPIQITMNANHTLVGDFQPIASKFFLTTSVTPAGAGAWILNPPQPADGYPAGTVVTATAVAT
jgi:hypothetical protein